MFGHVQQFLSPYVPQFIKSSYTYTIQKTYSAYQFVADSSYAQNLSATYQWIINNRYVCNFAEGIAQPIIYLPESLIAVKKSDKMQRVIKQVIKTNAPLLLTSIAYWGFIRPLGQTCIADEGYTQQAMDIAFATYLTAKLPRVTANDVMDTASFSSVISELMPKNNEGFECACQATLKTRANIESNVIYLTHRGIVLAISVMPWIGTPANLLLSPWFLGLVLAEYHFNMCNDHRYKEFSQNNVYFYGLGASVNLLVYGASKTIEDKLGVKSWFINLVLQNIVMKFAMLIAVLRDKPLPGKEVSIELFHYFRRMTENAFQDGVNKLHTHLRKKKNLPENQRIAQEIMHQQLFDSITKSLSYVANYTLGNEYAHLHTLVHTPSMQTFIQLKKDALKSAVDVIQNAHKYSTAGKIADKVIGIVPAFCFPSGVSKDEMKFFSKIVYHRTAIKVAGVIDKLVEHALTDPEKIRKAEDIDKMIADKMLESEVKVVLFDLIKTIEMQAPSLLDKKPMTIIDNHIPQVKHSPLIGRDLRTTPLRDNLKKQIIEAVEANNDIRYRALVDYFIHYEKNHQNSLNLFASSKASWRNYAYACWIMGADTLKELNLRISLVPPDLMSSSFQFSFSRALSEVKKIFVASEAERSLQLSRASAVDRKLDFKMA